MNILSLLTTGAQVFVVVNAAHRTHQPQHTEFRLDLSGTKHAVVSLDVNDTPDQAGVHINPADVIGAGLQIWSLASRASATPSPFDFTLDVGAEIYEVSGTVALVVDAKRVPTITPHATTGNNAQRVTEALGPQALAPPTA